MRRRRSQCMLDHVYAHATRPTIDLRARFVAIVVLRYMPVSLVWLFLFDLLGNDFNLT